MKQSVLTQAASAPQEFDIKRLHGDVYDISHAENVAEVVSGEDEQTQYEYDLFFGRVIAKGYEDIVNALVGLKYATADEIAVNRKGMGDRNDADYTAYLAYVKACKDYAREYFGVEPSAAQKEAEENAKYIPAPYASLVALAQNLMATAQIADDEQKLALSGLYKAWEAGKYEVGNIRNARGQTWECFQAHDNATYPDINPDNQSTWRTFWRPLHGKSRETARPWAAPTNATDIYKAGEYMVWTDGAVYRCKQDTNFSPEEYGAAWQVAE